MKNIELAKKYQDYMVKMRRYFHENPELSSKEMNTMNVIGKELKNLGIDYVDIPAGGILATINGPDEKNKGKKYCCVQIVMLCR
jgi:metal-dependent amidase/aminoacylase/carboxypeptidase family protein